MSTRQQSDELLLRSILDAIDSIAQHQKSQAPNYTVNKAVVFELICIGEACKKTSQEIQYKYPEVEWGEIISARNKMVHDYLEIDYKIVWNIVENHLPDLRPKIEAIIQKEWSK